MANPILVADIIDGIQTQKNYIKGQIDKNTAGWLGFTDASAATPVDGTGGAAPSVTWTISTTDPLRDSSSFLWTHPASNTRGQGFSYDFTIDRADRYSVLRVGFDYEVKSGTFDFGDSTSVDPGDLSIWLFDITNSVLIPLQQPYLNGGPFVSEFQSSDSTSYRLIVFSTTVTATAYTMAFDSFFVGARTVTHGAIISDWADGTATANLTTNATTVSKKRLIGDTVFYKVTTSFSGVNTQALNYTITIPEVIDTAKINTTTAGTDVLGSAKFYDASGSGSGGLFGEVRYSGASLVAVSVIDDATTDPHYMVSPNGSTNTPVTIASGDRIIVEFAVPVIGFSSNVVTSADSGTRVVAANITLSAQQSVSSTANTTVLYDTVDFDSAGLFSLADNGFKITESGYYHARAVVYITGLLAADNTSFELKVNGTVTAQTFFSTTATAAISAFVDKIVKLNAGDILKTATDSNTDAAYTIDGLNTGRSFFCISKIQSPQTIGMADKCKAIYESNSGQSITVAVVVINFEDKEIDTHNAVTTGAAWKWTAPQAGYARVNASIYFQNITTANGDVVGLAFRKNGSIWRQAFYEITAATTLSTSFNIDALIPVVAGDTIDLTGEFAGGPESLNATSTRNWISISLE